MRRTTILLISVLLLGGCATAADRTPPDTARAPDVAIEMFRFTPEELTVEAGASVSWRNADKIEHTVTSGTPDAPGGPLDHTFSATPGGTFTHTFDRSGVYEYFCARHSFMAGRIDVN